MRVSVRVEEPCNAHRQEANHCRRACDRRQEARKDKEPSNDCQNSKEANDQSRAARRGESVEPLRDRAQGNRDSQKD